MKNDLNRLLKVAKSLLEIINNNNKNDRVLVPLFKVISQFLSNNCFDPLQPPDYTFSSELIAGAKKEIAKTKEIIKVMTCVYL